MLFEIVGGWLNWASMRRVQLLLLPSMLLVVVMQFNHHLHPSADAGWAAWIAAFVAFYFILRRQQRDETAIAAAVQHVLAVWLATALIAWELAWQCAQASPDSSWPFAMRGVVPALVLWMLTRYGAACERWRADFAAFRTTCLGPMAAYGVLWSLLSSWDPARSAPLAYMPLINPIDLAQMVVLFSIHAWLRDCDGSGSADQNTGANLLAGLGFVWFNCMLLRSIHHWLGVPYELDDMFNSIVVQSALSIAWTLTALVVMVFSTRRMRRPMWLAGAALLAVVVGKLFLLDLANSGTVERIVSFLGVGVLLMIIGYAAPVPPGDAERQHD
jgi:uncharacterized membrane protein